PSPRSALRLVALGLLHRRHRRPRRLHLAPSLRTLHNIYVVDQCRPGKVAALAVRRNGEKDVPLSRRAYVLRRSPAALAIAAGLFGGDPLRPAAPRLRSP